jgi:hypothetical protein
MVGVCLRSLGPAQSEVISGGQVKGTETAWSKLMLRRPWRYIILSPRLRSAKENMTLLGGIQ